MATFTTVSCPNCGYKQGPAAKCRKCGSLFAYRSGNSQAPQLSAATKASPIFGRMGATVAGSSPAGPSLFSRIYSVVRWSSLAILVVAMVLILHQARPPLVDSDPNAAARLEAKLGALESGFAPGMHHELRLDEAELNSFLQSNLGLKRDANSSKPAEAPARHQAGPQVPPAARPVPGAGKRALPQGQPTAPAEADPAVEEVQSSVRDVKITLADDRVLAYVLFDFHGKDLSLILEGRLHVADGYLRFAPTSGKFGSLPLPQSTLESAVGRLFDSPENREKMRVPAKIHDIRIQNGELVVEYN